MPNSDLPTGEVVPVKDLDHDHPGVTPAVSQALCEAAAVCLARHHQPPKDFSVTMPTDSGRMRFSWDPPDQRAQSAHAYKHDATKDGAYAISLICVQHRMELVAVGEAEAGSGADWYVAPPNAGLDESGAPNLDDPGVRRLEVSGQDLGTPGYRVGVKKEQLRQGDSAIPGIASVVAFERAIVRIEHSVSEE